MKFEYVLICYIVTNITWKDHESYNLEILKNVCGMVNIHANTRKFEVTSMFNYASDQEGG